jgi:ASC-1-like (ASCH) protein
MQHLAVMRKSWGLVEKILAGEKTIESRWYKLKHSPWDKIKSGDIIYFKNSGEPVTVRARVARVLQFAGLTSEKIEQILAKYGRADLGTRDIMPEIKQHVSGKNYGILVFFDRVKKIKPFEIDKSGYGMMSAWITTESINKLKK